MGWKRNPDGTITYESETAADRLISKYGITGGQATSYRPDLAVNRLADKYGTSVVAPIEVRLAQQPAPQPATGFVDPMRGFEPPRQPGMGHGAGTQNMPTAPATAAAGFADPMRGFAEYVASTQTPAPAAAPSGGGGGGMSAFNTQRQMLEDLYAQQLQGVQGMYDMGQGQIASGLDTALGSLNTIRDQYMAQAAQMQQDQAAMLAGALGRVAQEQAMLNADLAAQGGRTVDPAAFDARGVLEAQGANQSALQSRLAELQAGAFADREGGAQSIAQGGRQQLDLQRLALQNQIQQERLQALANLDMARMGGGRGGDGGASGDENLPEGYFIDDAYGFPRGTFAASPTETQNQLMQNFTGMAGDPGSALADEAAAWYAMGPVTLDDGRVLQQWQVALDMTGDPITANAVREIGVQNAAGRATSAATRGIGAVTGLLRGGGSGSNNSRLATASASRPARDTRTPTRSGGTGRVPPRASRDTLTPTRG